MTHLSAVPDVPDPSAYWLSRGEACKIMAIRSPNLDKAMTKYKIATKVTYNGYKVYLRTDVEKAAEGIARSREHMEVRKARAMEQYKEATKGTTA